MSLSRARLLLLAAAVLSAASTARIEVHPAAACPDSRKNGATVTVCSLVDAAGFIHRNSVGPTTTTHICLHPGVHTLREPLRLNASHSGSRWTRCPQVDPAAAGPRAVISGGLRVPAGSWRPEAGGIWAAPLPAGAPVLHVRTLWVSGVRANRTVLNASSVLGDLQVTATGYVSQHPVPWQADAEDVELNYFQQLAPWQAQRCVLSHAAGHRLTVTQPCFATISRNAAAVPGLPRNRSSGRSGCADSDPECGLEGNPLGSGLPMFIENVPLADPGLPEGDGACPGRFSFSPKSQVLYYRPHPHELSADGTAFTAEAVVPVAEGLVAAVGLRDASFSAIDFEHMAWNSPSGPAGFVDLQDGVTALGYIPGGLDCMNCSDVSVTECGFEKLGGSGVTFNGVAQRISMAGLRVRDVSGNGIAIGASRGNDSRPFQSVDNTVTDCVVSYAGQEYTGAVGVTAGYNVGLVLSHNTVENVPYGAFSVGAGAARPGYARNNTVSYNRVARFMLKMSVQTLGMLILLEPFPSRICRCRRLCVCRRRRPTRAVEMRLA